MFIFNVNGNLNGLSGSILLLGMPFTQPKCRLGPANYNRALGQPLGLSVSSKNLVHLELRDFYEAHGLINKISVALLFIAVVFNVGCFGPAPSRYPDHTVQAVDLKAYSGKWFEIASFPNWFQKDCYCTTAQYTDRIDYVEVINSCRRGGPDGTLDVATAKAWPIEGTDNTQLKVQFQWPFRGDYWIIYLDEGYRYAAVGHPAKKYLWILSRTPFMDDAVYLSIVEAVRKKGYDTSRLRRTQQTCAQ
jgi:apolipoprotein D and lipocalin family protein